MKNFTTSRGITIEFLPIPTLLEKLQAQHKTPEPPTYEIKAATGVTERHAHDETTLESDEDKAAWADYQERLKTATNQFNLALMRLVMLRGIKVELPEGNAWVEEQEFIGLTVPTEPTERKLHWLETEVLADRNDYMQVIVGVMEASGVPEEVVSQAEATFRGQVVGQGAGRPAAPSNGKGLDHEQPVRAGARRHKVGHPARE